MTKKIKKSIFVWEGHDKNKSRQTGEINAISIALAKSALRKRGITPIKIRRKRLSINLLKGKPIKPLDIALLTRQLSTMVKSGVPMLQGFDIVSEGVDKPSMKELIQCIKKDVQEGLSLSESLHKHPKYFDELYCNLIATGEQAGALDTLLDRIATYKEKTEALKARVKKAMNYPIIVVLVSIIVTGILLVKVVPQFEEIFQGFGAELPMFTQLVIGFSEYIQDTWYLIILSFLLAGFGIRALLKRSQKARDNRDKMLLKLPVVGSIIDKSTIARLTRTLSTTFAAGVPLTEALTSISSATGNAVYRDATEDIRKEVSSGQALQSAMKNTGKFPNMAVQMVAVGEESGSLDEMLDKVASYYEEEVDNMVDGLTSMLEPMIMIVLGILVGGLIIAMYLPIFELGSVV